VIEIDYDGGIDLVLVINSKITIYYSNVVLKSADDFCSSKLTSLPYIFDNSQYISTISIDGYTLSPVQQIIHLADINSDGYPDMLLMMQNSSNVSYPYFLDNEPAGQTGTVEMRTFKNPFLVI
jgi:hypothetical protein